MNAARHPSFQPLLRFLFVCKDVDVSCRLELFSQHPLEADHLLLGFEDLFLELLLEAALLALLDVVFDFAELGFDVLLLEWVSKGAILCTCLCVRGDW